KESSDRLGASVEIFCYAAHYPAVRMQNCSENSHDSGKTAEKALLISFRNLSESELSDVELVLLLNESLPKADGFKPDHYSIYFKKQAKEGSSFFSLPEGEYFGSLILHRSRTVPFLYSSQSRIIFHFGIQEKYSEKEDKNIIAESGQKKCEILKDSYPVEVLCPKLYVRKKDNPSFELSFRETEYSGSMTGGLWTGSLFMSAVFMNPFGVLIPFAAGPVVLERKVDYNADFKDQ
ncbi:MAG TPA: hypothetical protein PK683_15170, partial [Leptospiraceae bacterium]|nr:hypothetical protein [Leptospiraceae bacterium]